MDCVVELEGIVSSGLGEGVRLTQLDWVLDQFRNKLGFTPFPGTFNLRVEGPEWEGFRLMSDSYTGIAIVPPAGFCAARCYRARIGDRITGAVVVPEVEGYPGDKVEIVAPVSVRKSLGLHDGDAVRLHMELE